MNLQQNSTTSDSSTLKQHKKTSYPDRWLSPRRRWHQWWWSSVGWERGSVPSSVRSVCRWRPSAPLHSETCPAHTNTHTHINSIYNLLLETYFYMKNFHLEVDKSVWLTTEHSGVFGSSPASTLALWTMSLMVSIHLSTPTNCNT